MIGAGVVGLACAVELGRRWGPIVVIDREIGPGRETSSRNSGVIHAGLYYPEQSLKTKLCIEGKNLLYQWCEAHQVPHARTGKLIVATTDGEERRLRALARHAARVGAGALRFWDGAETKRREPEIRCQAALWSPTSGVVDVHELIESLARAVREADGAIVFQTRAESLRRDGDRWLVRTTDSMGREAEIRTPRLVNAAGLSAIEVAARSGLEPSERPWRLHPCKGSYFTLSSKAPSTHASLIYPLPEEAGLGIHLTTDLAGGRRAGPDVEFVDGIDYQLDESKAKRFAAAVGRYLPGIRTEHLTPDYVGIRPKLAGPGEGIADFVIAQPRSQPGAVHLIGIESPGLTAALAIGRFVTRLMR